MHLPGDIMSQLMHPPRRHFVPLSQFESPHLGQSYKKTIVQLAFFGRQIVSSDKMSHFLKYPQKTLLLLPENVPKMQPSPFVVNCSRQLKSASFVLKYMQDFSKHVKSANCLARSSGALTMANLTSCLVARLREYISLLERVRLVGGTH